MAGSKAAFAALCAVPFIWALSNSMIIPVLPEIRSALGISTIQAGLMVTALSVPTGLFLPLAGSLSDRFSRRLVLVPSIVLYGLGGLWAGLASLMLEKPYLSILLGRAIQGTGAAGTTLLAMALTADMYRGNERFRSLGYLEASNSSGKLASPLIGSATVLLGWYVPFFVYPLFSLPIAAGIWYAVREPAPQGKTGSGLKDCLVSLAGAVKSKRRSLIACLLAGFLSIAAWFGVLYYLSEMLVQRFELSSVARGGLLAFPVAMLALVSVGSTQWLKRLGLVRLVGGGLALVSSALIAMSLLSGRWWLFGATAFVGAGLGLVLPSLNTLITSAFGENQRGTVTTAYGTVRALGSAVGPPSFALLMEAGDGYAFLLAAMLLGLGAILSLWWIKEREMLPPELRS